MGLIQLSVPMLSSKSLFFTAKKRASWVAFFSPKKNNFSSGSDFHYNLGQKPLLLLLFLLSFNCFAQEDAWVYFNNKPNSRTYLDNPLTMLSQRALDRRTAQDIALSVQDTPIHQPYIDQITTTPNITVLAKSKWLNCLHIRGSIANITTLTALSFVDHVTFANRTLNNRISNQTTINLVNKQLETTATFPYGTSNNQIQMLSGDLLHQQNYTGTGKIIAVLDSGFPNVNLGTTFQRLRDNNQILGGYDFVGKSNNFYSRNSHGTLVLSDIGGYVDNQLVGTAPDAKFYLYITEDVASETPLEESNWVEAAEMADYVGADIITTSLGYFGYDNSAYSHLYSDMTGDKTFSSKGANIAFSKGIVVVVSAGNSGATADPHIGSPADATFALTVGAVTATRTVTGFSSIGPSFDNRVKPDVMAQGESAVVSGGTSISTASGTSFSCPIMAGMVACLWQAFPNFTNSQIVNLIKQSSDNFSTPNASYGYGIPNFQTALNNGNLLANPSFNNLAFSEYPNPFQNEIVFKFDSNFTNTSLEIYNNLGQKVLEKENLISNTPISTSSLSQGTYFYKISSSNGIQQGKLLKK